MADRSCRCFLVVCVFYLCFRFSHGVLYSTADHMVLLENNTISNVIHNSPSAWFVEFYSSFCGHCHAFAPTWKKLAKMSKGKGTISLKRSQIMSYVDLEGKEKGKKRQERNDKGLHLLDYPLFRSDIFLMKSQRYQDVIGQRRLERFQRLAHFCFPIFSLCFFVKDTKIKFPLKGSAERSKIIPLTSGPVSLFG